MTPIWATIVIAAISALAGLGTQWLMSLRSFRLAAIERKAGRQERRLTNRDDAYAKFLAAARAFAPALRPGGSPDAGDAAKNRLDEAAAYVEMYAPELADGPLAAVSETANRFHRLVASNPATAPAVKEAEAAFQQAVIGMRDAIWVDLSEGS